MSVNLFVSDLFFNHDIGFNSIQINRDQNLLVEKAKDFLEMLEPICAVDLPTDVELALDYLDRL